MWELSARPRSISLDWISSRDYLQGMQTKTFELVIGTAAPYTTSKHDVRDVHDMIAIVAAKFPGAKCVLRGYTTWRVYVDGKAIGSFQEV
jgi:hypothetical protein